MARELAVAIVGYGIAGIAAAIHLRRSGHLISHFDRNAPPIAPGAGMLLHPPALRQLDQLGVLTAALSCGARVRRITAETAQGRRLMDFRYENFAVNQVGLGIQRGTLHRLLSSADPGRDRVCGGRKITSLDSDRGYLFEDSDIPHGPYDLIIVADGAHSNLRQQIQADLRVDRLANSAALVGLIDDPDQLAGDQLMQYFDAAGHVSVWPVGCDAMGGRPRCSIAMNVTTADATAFRDQGTWRKRLARLCPDIDGLVHRCMDNASLHIFTYRHVELSHSNFGRVILIGDAAHSMSPQFGNGAQLAMEDAALLATAIGQHNEVPIALSEYARSRSLQLRRYHRANRWLTPLFQSNNRWLSGLRDHLFAISTGLPISNRLTHALLCR